jgi:outer membrane protein assembly factor BamB
VKAIMKRSHAGALCLAALLCTLAACKSSNKPDKPLALVDFPAQFALKRVWSASIGNGQPKLKLGLAPVADGQRLYVANGKGTVLALDARSGKRLWEQHLKAQLSGGPGAGGELVLLGTASGAIIALNAADGAQRWRTQLNSEILSAPVVSGDLVAVRTVDGKLIGLAAGDGKQRWVADQQVPRLTLRGTSAPIIAGDYAIAGFDNGRLMAVTLVGGTTAWDVAVSQARGSSELQRLIDIDGPPVADLDELYVVGFQGHVARLSRDSGREIWSHEISSFRGLALDAVGVLVATAEGEVVKLDRAGGAERWRQKGLLRHTLTRPAVLGESVVVGDAQGYLHWLGTEKGEFQARVKVGAPLSAAPIVVGDLLIVQTDKGAIEAWRKSAR